MFERILVAVDPSEPSTRAVRLARPGEGTRLGGRRAPRVPRQVTKFGTSELEVPESQELVDRAVRELKDDGANARGEVIRVLEGHVPRGIVGDRGGHRCGRDRAGDEGHL